MSFGFESRPLRARKILIILEEKSEKVTILYHSRILLLLNVADWPLSLSLAQPSRLHENPP
jgi:hypothetical protein